MDRTENSAATRLHQQSSVRGWPDRMRWSGCFALALGIHAMGVAALLAHWNDDADAVWHAPAITVDLAATPAAPAIQATELPPGPLAPQREAQPRSVQEKPIEKSESAPDPATNKPLENRAITAEPVEKPELTSVPPANLIEKPKQRETKTSRRTLASLASAPSTTERQAERAVALAPGASSYNPNAAPNWKSRLVAQLERYKQYPIEARGEHGVARLAFSIDRSGGVHHARILHSSGSNLLDAATLSLVQRAAPLPAPPPEVPGAQIAIVVPIRYNVR